MDNIVAGHPRCSPRQREYPSLLARQILLLSGVLSGLLAHRYTLLPSFDPLFRCLQACMRSLSPLPNAALYPSLPSQISFYTLSSPFNSLSVGCRKVRLANYLRMSIPRISTNQNALSLIQPWPGTLSHS